MAPKKAKAKAEPKKAESKKTPKAKAGKRSAMAEVAGSAKVPKVEVDDSKALEELLGGLQETTWKEALSDEFGKDYFADIARFVQAERSSCTVHPPTDQVFSAFNETPFDKVRVVIIGQDPYHEPGQAHGMCFSVRPGIKTPPSLANIYKELEIDIPGFQSPGHGYLLSWAQQGVLLLNATLTVREGHKEETDCVQVDLCGHQSLEREARRCGVLALGQLRTEKGEGAGQEAAQSSDRRSSKPFECEVLARLQNLFADAPASTYLSSGRCAALRPKTQGRTVTGNVLTLQTRPVAVRMSEKNKKPDLENQPTIIL